MKSLSESERELLKSLYVQYDTPVDAFVSNWDRLAELVDEFNGQVQGAFTPDAILHFMMTQRKRGRWPRIRRQYAGRQVNRAS